MIYVSIVLVLFCAWREWENQRERRALLDRILGYKVILPPKLQKHEIKRQPSDDKAVPV